MRLWILSLREIKKTYIISVDYRHHTILSCYANDILTFKIDLSNSLVKTIVCDNCAIITVFKRSQKHKLNDECCLIIDINCEYIEFPSGSRDTKKS